MKIYVKIIIGIIVLFILFLIFRKKIPFLKEHFSAGPCPSPCPTPTQFVTSYGNLKEDLKDMRVIIISFYYSDTCPKSREFLYGCCEDVEGTFNNKNTLTVNKNDDKNDSYMNKILKWFKKDMNTDNNIIAKTEFYKDIPASDNKCLDLSNFQEVSQNSQSSIFKNKCILEKKPTYFYLEEFINKFNNDYQTDIGFEDLYEVMYSDNNGMFKQTNLDNINYKIRLKVEEFDNPNEIASLFIEIPRFPGLNEGDNVSRSKHRFIGNINNMNEVASFINDYLNISLQEDKIIKTYNIIDGKLKKNENKWEYGPIPLSLEINKSYKLKDISNHEKINKIIIKKGDKKETIDNDISQDIDINNLPIDKTNINNKLQSIESIENIEKNMLPDKILTQKEKNDYKSLISEEYELIIEFNKEPNEEDKFTLIENDDENYIINLFHNQVSGNQDSYKKNIRFNKTLVDKKFYNSENKFKDYIAYLYNEFINSNTPYPYKVLDGYYEKFKPRITTYDFMEEFRFEDINNRIAENNYLYVRPRIMWKNIITFPEPRNDYIAIIMRDKYLEEYYRGYEGGKSKLIYWIMWNIPKTDMELLEAKYDNLVNSDNKLTEGVRLYTELYPYKLFDSSNIQYYFDENDILKRQAKLSKGNIGVNQYTTVNPNIITDVRNLDLPTDYDLSDLPPECSSLIFSPGLSELGPSPTLSDCNSKWLEIPEKDRTFENFTSEVNT